MKNNTGDEALTRYYYEALDEKSFQKLVQALIVAQFPRAQCLPVGQPDGGRDAFLFRDEPDESGFEVFQVKYSRSPNDKNERDVIQDLIKTEKEKVDKLIERGATQYYLITNVQGTAHLDTGAVDKTNAYLTKEFGIPSMVWWRNDIDSRLDNQLDIRWRYPEILLATDLLPLLFKGHQRPNANAIRALKSYIATQHENDREIKFKQVELKRALIDLFVDLPLGKKRLQEDQDGSRRVTRSDVPGEMDLYLDQLEPDDDFDSEDIPYRGATRLAASFLLGMPSINGVSRFVLEGAPGQGKSTVTQFLCQVNRMRLLHKEREIKGLAEEYREGVARVPFRADLRDYAAWVSGRSPFSTERHLSVPEEGRRSLESFLAMQVTCDSGAGGINEDDLLDIIEHSHCVIVLDGFDEVVDIDTRTKLVSEICRASARLDAHARSMQIIVTSRPAAFANSPGFPENDWVHLELRDLRRKNIREYKSKWVGARDLNKQEGDTLSATLEQKLGQPHISDLARNPMQLSILLHLIHVQGSALPEKRTTLYEEYMKLFFNREAEKSPTVRDHRELLLSIHGELAWVLHTQAEEGLGSGSITKDELRARIRNCLEAEEYDVGLADELLMGASERAGALVSRVQGTFEFEVQPLREYFAAWHLYNTAPLSPVGKPQSGTRPDRFQALARSFYWTNVTRFFCGFYAKGELGTLFDDLLQLGDEEGYSLINQPRHLAMMLLSDHVFAQSPKRMRRLIAYVSEEPGFQRLITALARERGRGMALPVSAGRDMLFDVCLKKLNEENDPGRRSVLREVMAENAGWSTLKSLWEQRFRDGLMRCDPLTEAMDFRLLSRFEVDEIEKLAKGNDNLRLEWLMRKGHSKAIIEDPTLYSMAKKALFENHGMIYGARRIRNRLPTVVEVLADLLTVPGLGDLFSAPSGSDAFSALAKWRYVHGWNPLEGNDNDCYFDDSDPLTALMEFTLELLKRPVEYWQEETTPWSDLVDRGFEVAPGGWRFAEIAAVSTAVQTSEKSGWHSDGFGLTKGLVGRLCFSRQMAGDATWWRSRLTDHVGSDEAVLALAILLSWAESNVLLSLKSTIGSIIDDLDDSDWSRLWICFNNISRAAKDHRPDLTDDLLSQVGSMSARMALVIICRAGGGNTQERLSREAFAKYDGSDLQILWYAANLELERSEPGDIDWDFVCHLSKRCRESGAIAMFSTRHFHLWHHVPENIAVAVLNECDSHDEHLLVVCERAYAMKIAREADKVYEVARTDDWFAAHPE